MASDLADRYQIPGSGKEYRVIEVYDGGVVLAAEVKLHDGSTGDEILETSRAELDQLVANGDLAPINDS